MSTNLVCSNRLFYIPFQKQAEVLLNADDLDTMWVLLRENCSIDEASNTEKVGILFLIYLFEHCLSVSHHASQQNYLLHWWILTWVSILGMQMNYEDFCHIATLCTEQLGPKCRKFFSACNFLKFEKDDFGRIAILPFYLYVMRTVSRVWPKLHHPITVRYGQFRTPKWWNN